MERPLPVLPFAQPARTCVWSEAGVIAFKLCDRACACDRCPLDAALRGDPRLTLENGADLARPPHIPWSFPLDRLYAPGHMWLQIIHSGHARAGIDACAAWLLPPILSAKTLPRPCVARGEPLCVLGFPAGELSPASPISGSRCAWNEKLNTEPELLTSDPYGAGWIVELRPAGTAELGALQQADDAARNARLVARRFGRQAAFGLLSAGETAWVDSGLLEATQRALGATAYLQIARDCLA